MRIQAGSKDEYFELVGERAEDLRVVDQLIRENAPDLKPALAGGMYGDMLGYGLMKYRPKSAKEETEWPVLMLGAQKNHLALYVCAVDESGVYFAEKYKDRLGKVSVGKSCIRFKKASDFNTETLSEMLTTLNKLYISGTKLYGE